MAQARWPASACQLSGLSRNRGAAKGNALREGFVHCTGDIVVALDADGSMDPKEIPAIVAFLESGA